jgi:hypothetical protein
MNKIEFGDAVRMSITQAVDDMFRADDGEFWGFFDGAVVGSLEQGSYNLDMCILDGDAGLAMLLIGGDGDPLGSIGFRKVFEDGVLAEGGLETDRKAAAISDLEWALIELKKMRE